jgi:uncharacterized membrane protein YbhN (UPF0104 family)
MNSVSINGRTQRIFSLLSLFMLCGIPITALAVIFLGQEEMRANAAFGLIVVSVFAIISILLSYSADLRTQKISQFSWILVALACLAFSLNVVTQDVPEAHKAADAVLLTTMFVLTFPSGIVAIVAVVVYSLYFLPTRGAGTFELFIFWLLFFAVGYVQWFRIVPSLSRRWRNRHARDAKAAI